MTVLDLAAPFLGLATLITVGVLGWSVWTYFTTPEDQARTLPRRGRLVYRAGLGVTVLSFVMVLGLVAWALGRVVLGGW